MVRLADKDGSGGARARSRSKSSPKLSRRMMPLQTRSTQHPTRNRAPTDGARLQVAGGAAPLSRAPR
eukprot:scaffold10326_cov48-Phaeocystis_antarctica.AAC.1